ncbi:MAG: MerR family transcriptional regulator [Microlunatus sp.]|nr:MerR family transcriptional regulator [Microlunatus sp.]
MTGLTIHALRHYDDVDLLRPAMTDPGTGYRRYARSQTAMARMITDLRRLDLPIEEIRPILADPVGAAATAALQRHRDRLERASIRIADQLHTIDRYVSEGIAMSNATSNATSTMITTAIPVLLKVAVDDIDAAREFYSAAFGWREQVARHTDDEDFSGYVFGEYGQPDFFLIFLTQNDWNELDRPGPSTFGLLVPDLDAAHARALKAGAVEAFPPRDAQGMPRHSAVKDPSGNWIGLTQA